MSTLQIMPWDQKDQYEKTCHQKACKIQKNKPQKNADFQKFPQRPTRRTHGRVKVPEVIWDPFGASGPQTMAKLSRPILRFDVFSPAQCVKEKNDFDNLWKIIDILCRQCIIT